MVIKIELDRLIQSIGSRIRILINLFRFENRHAEELRFKQKKLVEKTKINQKPENQRFRQLLKSNRILILIYKNTIKDFILKYSN